MTNYNEKPRDRNFDQASKQQNRTGSSNVADKSRSGSAGQTQRPQSPTNR